MRAPRKKRVFTGVEAAAVAGVAYHVVNSWARSGFLRPSLQEATGSGSTRGYSLADVVAIRVVALLKAATSHDQLRTAIACLQSATLDAPEVHESVLVIGCDGDATLATKLEVGKLLEKHGACFLISIGSVLAELPTFEVESNFRCQKGVGK